MNKDHQIDLALDSVLRASGSGLKYHTMPLTLEKMREAMRVVMAESYLTGSNDTFNAALAAEIRRVDAFK